MKKTRKILSSVAVAAWEGVVPERGQVPVRRAARPVGLRVAVALQVARVAAPRQEALARHAPAVSAVAVGRAVARQELVA
jgi:hypothetical protein